MCSGLWKEGRTRVTHLALVLGQSLPRLREQRRLLGDVGLALQDARVGSLGADLVAEPVRTRRLAMVSTRDSNLPSPTFLRAPR